MFQAISFFSLRVDKALIEFPQWFDKFRNPTSAKNAVTSERQVYWHRQIKKNLISCLYLGRYTKPASTIKLIFTKPTPQICMKIKRD